MNEDKKFSIGVIKAKFVAALRQIGKYIILLFLLFVILIYGFVWVKINNFNNAEPSPQQVSGQVRASSLPHIDPTILKQIQGLQDNSVNVQALFNQSRSNPFN